MNYSRPKRERSWSLFSSLKIQFSTGRSAIVPDVFVVSISPRSRQIQIYLRLWLDHFHIISNLLFTTTLPLHIMVQVPGTEERHASFRQHSRFLAHDKKPRLSEDKARCYPFCKSRSWRHSHGCPRFITPDHHVKSRYCCNYIDD
jgi:hypothetical protein